MCVLYVNQTRQTILLYPRGPTFLTATTWSLRVSIYCASPVPAGETISPLILTVHINKIPTPIRHKNKSNFTMKCG
ncbi:hypothetical protein DPMN_143739 [Dreissena polymorpha]|uniref:Uncharacterized protein n=1 Tax=Dreissena polymorpha TaxID=45954 RepID=A0A9D4GGR9_DREPO|nr:hypothetical protein DPMN_143739 [Dreissena polymorpha]